MANQVPIVVGIIRDEDGNILISRRKDPEVPEADGKWEFVGGRIEFKETPEEAIIREAKEESGLDVEIIRLMPKVPTSLWVKNGEEVQVILIYFECKIVGGSLLADPKDFDRKISELKFIKPHEIVAYDTLPEIKEMIQLL